MDSRANEGKSKSPVDVIYPYWGRYKWDGELLLSDFDTWHHPLKNWFLPSDLDHEEIFEADFIIRSHQVGRMIIRRINRIYGTV